MIQLDGQRLKQIRYMGITEEDLKLLSSMKHHLEAIAHRVVDKLYEHITAEPQLLGIIDKFSTLDRLKETQREYFISLGNGSIDENYIQHRLKIGGIHSRIGLTTDWYLGTYALYSKISKQYLQETAPDHWVELTYAIQKIFNFDSQLVLEAYEAGEKRKVQDIADQRNDILKAVNQAVQELASMMVELSSSTQMIAETATSTAEAQDESHTLMNKLYEEVREIGQMGTLMREISDQTHLLGLNAAIEAAHAGAHGRSFEVVANEIRKLAANSKTSLDAVQKRLKEINEKLNNMQAGMEKTSEYARHQAAVSQELASFVVMIEKVTEELERAANE